MTVINFGLTKRQKIIIASGLVTFGLLSTQLVNFNLRFKFLAGLALLTYLVSFWALREGLNWTKAVVLMILPTFFTLAVASFYFLLPVRWLTRVPVAVSFGLLFYLVLLAQNVFNVAAMRTIPLYRAASTASFLFTLLSSFFIYNVIDSLDLSFYWNALVIALVSFPLILQVIWSIEMEERVNFSVLAQSLILSLIIGELGLAFSFWPMANTIWSLSLSSAMYILLGITTHIMRAKVGKRIIAEYLTIGAIVLVVAFLTTSWTG